MALSILSPTGFSNGFSGPERSVGQSAPNTATTAVSAEDAAPSTRESSSERPVTESQQANGLTAEEQRQLAELRQRDREVKAHELAHKSVAGRYVTGGSFTYQTGPDGQRYAIGGEVTIDRSSGRTPEETLRKAELIQRAALAPADPSPQDYQVAASAAATAAEARAEIRTQQLQALQQRQAAQAERNDSARLTGTITPLGRRAITSFASVGGSGALRSDPTPIDELI
ncbi:MAG: putative metalloprotease CJM1_0395 family protein [Candidatus Thiodiazotropha sp.]